MVQNRSFEFTSLAKGDEKHGWSDIGGITARVETGDKAGALNENNPNYMVLENVSDAGELEDTADVALVAGESLTDDNILGREEVVTMESSRVSGISSQFNYTVPAYSVTVLRLHRK